MQSPSPAIEHPEVARALQLHRDGRVPEAIAAYEALLATPAAAPGLRHNLGMLLLLQGQVLPGMKHLERAWLEDGGQPVWAQSMPTIGMNLYAHGYWDDALRWLKRCALWGVFDERMREAMERCTLRADLKPEVFDPVLQRTLRRHPPRESAQYVYAIDVVGTCNLRCPTCPVGNSAAVSRPKGFMKMELFERVLDKIVAERVSSAPEVWLFNWGEPLLHPELPSMIRAIRDRGLRCHLSSNLNVVKGLREVVQAGPHDFKISLSSWRADDYAQTHAGGNLALVKSNMYQLRHWMDHYSQDFRVWVGHHLYKDRLDEVETVKGVCDELGFEHHPIPAFYQPLERLIEVIRPEQPRHAPVLDRLLEHPQQYVARIRQERSADHDCELRFNQTAINFDGSVALCCSVYEPEQMLNLSFVDTPHEALQQAKYQHPFCATCMKSGTAYAFKRLS